MPKSVSLTAKRKTMRGFIAALTKAGACVTACQRAGEFTTPQAFWRVLGANEAAARYASLYTDSSAEWMCRLLRLIEGRRHFHPTHDCQRCKSDPAAILRAFPRIGMKDGKIVAYPAKGTK